MKSYFISKTLMWRVVFSIFALAALVGLLQLNKSFSSIETGIIQSPDELQQQNQQQQGQQQQNQQQQNSQPRPGGQPQQPLVPGNKSPGSSVAKDGSRSQYFIEYRLQRDRVRGQQIDMLRELVNNEKSSDDLRKEAQKSLLQITQVIEKEMEIENMIRAKDFKDAVVFLEAKTATVIVQVDVLNSDDEADIKAIVQRITGINEEKIVIVSKI